jgi:hypothetical protein
LAIAAWVIGLATTVGFVGAAGFAVCAAELVLVVGIAAETLSSGAAAEDVEVFVRVFAAVFLAVEDSVAGVLLADLPVALVAFAADDDVVVEVFTVAVFVAGVFAFAFAAGAFDEVFAVAFAAVLATSGLALFAVLVATALVAVVVFVAAFLAAGAVFLAAAFTGGLAGAAFFAAAAFLTGAAFLAGAATFPAAALEAVVLVVLAFFALDVAALGMLHLPGGSSADTIDDRPHVGPDKRGIGRKYFPALDFCDHSTPSLNWDCSEKSDSDNLEE